MHPSFSLLNAFSCATAIAQRRTLAPTTAMPAFEVGRTLPYGDWWD